MMDSLGDITSVLEESEGFSEGSFTHREFFTDGVHEEGPHVLQFIYHIFAEVEEEIRKDE
jgi:hypothetical protein